MRAAGSVVRDAPSFRHQPYLVGLRRLPCGLNSREVLLSSQWRSDQQENIKRTNRISQLAASSVGAFPTAPVFSALIPTAFLPTRIWFSTSVRTLQTDFSVASAPHWMRPRRKLRRRCVGSPGTATRLSRRSSLRWRTSPAKSKRRKEDSVQAIPEYTPNERDRRLGGGGIDCDQARPFEPDSRLTLLTLRTPGSPRRDGAARNVVGIWWGAISGNMKVSFQAARSIG